MKSDFSGVFTALITPFKNGEIDFPSLSKLLKLQMDGKVNGLVVNGTTAESPTLTTDEIKKLYQFTRQETGGTIPIVLGTGSNSTAATVLATQAAADLGADGALVVVPYYNNPSQRGLFQHFQKVAECSKLPILLYNVPGRTITKLEISTITELAALPNVVGIKEASGDIEFGQQLKTKLTSVDPDFLLTSGDDGTFLDLATVGGRGVISVASNIMPREFVSWCDRAKAGDLSGRAEFEKYSELNSYLYVEANPIPIKAALYLMGVIESPELRLPMTALSEPFMMELKNKMMAVGLV